MGATDVDHSQTHNNPKAIHKSSYVLTTAEYVASFNYIYKQSCS